MDKTGYYIIYDDETHETPEPKVEVFATYADYKMFVSELCGRIRKVGRCRVTNHKAFERKG